MKSWQERYALYMLERNQRRFRKWNGLVANIVAGLILASGLIIVLNVAVSGVSDTVFATAPITDSFVSSNTEMEEKVRVLKSENESYRMFLRDGFSYARAYIYVGAGCVVLGFILVGLIAEERKGYHRVIENLQQRKSQSEQAEKGNE